MTLPEPTRIPPVEPVLAVAGLTKTYRSGFWGRRGKPAVCELNLTVGRGEVVALLGHNGAGKTTTLKAILGLIRPDQGSVTICGRDASRPEARACVGYLPEAPYFHENLSAAELLDFHGKLLGLSRARRLERAERCLQMVGMADERRRRVGACSKGQRQRLGLAQALLGEPELLILDEPQSGLDPLGRREVREIMLAQRERGVTILFSSHIVPDVEAVADRVAILGQGRVLEVQDLRTRPAAGRLQAWLATPPADLGARWRAEPDLLVREVRDGRWLLEAIDVAVFARLLAECARHEVAVLDLQATTSSLEDTFLARLRGEAPAAAAQPDREVVPC